MRLTLYSSFATHSEAVAIAVAVVDCPNLNRPPAIIPPLHHSSITLAALILFAPFPSSPILIIPSPSHYNIYTLQQKVFNSIKILPYKSRRTYGRIYPSNFFFRDRQKERKETLDSTRIEPAWGS